MATKKKVAVRQNPEGSTATVEGPSSPEVDAKRSVRIRPIEKEYVTFKIDGTDPIVMHAWGDKSKTMLRQKGLGKKTKDRTKREPKNEAESGLHLTEDGQVGIPVGAMRKALINAAHKDIGIEKTLVRKSIFFVVDDEGHVAKIKHGKKILREDTVRLAQGSTDLRYRYEFRDWSCVLTAEIDSDMIQVGDLLTLVNRAGFGVGLLEMRPEKSGELGRFEVDESFDTRVSNINPTREGV